MDIHKIVNANGLAKKLINLIPGRENEGLTELYKTRIAFDKFVDSNNPWQKISRLTEFIHKAGDFPYSTYTNGESQEDTSYFSLYDVSNRINSGAKKTGNCLGTTQIGLYLLSTNGISTEIGTAPNHIFLEASTDGYSKIIETTTRSGKFDYSNKYFKFSKLEYLECGIKNTLAYSQFNKNPKKAFQYYNELAKTYPHYDSTFFNRGLFFTRNHEFKKAIKDYSKAIKLNPKNDSSFYNRANCWYKLGEFQKAIDDYTEKIKLNPDARAYNNRGNCFNKMDLWEEANKDWNKAYLIEKMESSND